MTDNTEREALEELLNKVDHEGGWDAFFNHAFFSPKDYPGVPQRVLDSLFDLNEDYQQWWADLVTFEEDLLDDYGVEL